MSARLLVVDDDPSARSIIRKALASEGLDVHEATGADEALPEIRRLKPGVVLLDLFLPEPKGIDLLREISVLPDPPYVIVITGHAEHTFVMEAMRWGAYDYVVKPFDIDRLRSVVKDAVASSVQRPTASAGRGREAVPKPGLEQESVIGVSPAMQDVFKLAGRAASSEETVLLSGESGVGKEVVARLIHTHSHRKDGPFLSVNCAAIPAGLVEAELFGYERGAFTGADRSKSGKFAMAHRGTLFLDEVGELPLDAQAKLLRVLQDKEVTPLGTSRSMKVDARVLCASNTDLQERVRQGRFREDLYYRLAVIEISIPPLRQRRPDIPPLVRMFTEEALRENRLRGGGPTAEAIDALARYEFPGNVRELKNLIKKLVAIHRERPITPDLLPDQVQSGVGRPGGDWRVGLSREVQERLKAGESGLADRFRAELDDMLIRETLEHTRGNQMKAAEILGIHRNTLRRKRT
ncbi:MAG: sigma-54-dependent Fis family transcriptional regulator [Nitrospirae bacterium]|nr:sigma-54-dependent Fis family transcriptional regulator [Nitrospirota bacterium]